jgi:YD repeat-containing protein
LAAGSVAGKPRHTLYAWDADEQLQTVTDNRANGMTTYAYDATNQLSSMQYANDISHAFTYDLRDRPTNLSVTTGTSVFATYAQTFSPSGRKLSAAESNGRTPNYGYDAIYRLLNETITGDPTPSITVR